LPSGANLPPVVPSRLEVKYKIESLKSKTGEYSGYFVLMDGPRFSTFTTAGILIND